MADLPTNFGSVKFASVSFNQHQKLVAGTGTFDVDPAVARCMSPIPISGNYLTHPALPEGSKVIEGVPWGTSAWTVTSKVRVQGPDGVEQAYFMKTAVERGAVMMEGEFNSLKTIRATVPLFAPEVYGWGKFDLSDTYFLLMDFLDLRMVLPDPSKICSKVVEMHQSSISPTGKFGFALPTCHGKHIQPNDWDTSWCRFFTRLVTIFFETDLEINGPWQEYEDAFAVLKSVVIPSLLEPLQSDGRVLKPCLIHGDLWEENMGIDLETGNCVVFDASVFYAHNEYELGIWRQPHQRIGIAHRKQYMRYMPPSEPAEQWDDRNLLYSIKFSLAHAAGWTGTNNVREA